MTARVQGIRGMEDVLPDASALWERLEDACREVFHQYGYRNIRTPIVEPTALFVRGLGEVTDIVEKEMYVFEDRNGESLALRPEATAGIVRSAIEHNFLYNGPLRVWTTGPMFRYERPQKGRYRQFHQFDVEALGFAGPDVDAEQIVMLARLWKALGIREVDLHVNSIGDAADRKAHREKLVAYFERHAAVLDEDAKRRLHSNPLRILDSKNPAMQEMIEGAPRLLDHLGVEKAIFCGHDWGGIVVWQMPLWRPEKTAGVIGLNTPFMPRAPADPIAIMRARFGEQMYIVHFQKPGEADAVLDANARKAMDFFMRRPAAGTEVASGIGGGEDEQNTFPLIEILKLYDPAFDEREFFLTDDEFEAFVETFERTGFTGGINWYRNFTRNWEISEGKPARIEGIPCLMVMAEKDAVLPPAAADGMEAYVADLEKVLVKDSGHWTQQEQPEAVNRILLDWLDRRFPK